VIQILLCDSNWLVKACDFVFSFIYLYIYMCVCVCVGIL
jgi:hypothetical protein